MIDRARREDVMIYAIGMRSRGARPAMPGIGPGGLQAMMTADLPDPGLARVAEETGGGYMEVRFGQDLGAAFARSPTNCTAVSARLRAAQTRRQGARHRGADDEGGGMKARARKSYVAPKS